MTSLLKWHAMMSIAQRLPTTESQACSRLIVPAVASQGCRLCQKIKIADTDRKLKLRFIMDRQSIELFINDGQQVATTAICTPLQADGICFNCDGSAVVDIENMI